MMNQVDKQVGLPADPLLRRYHLGCGGVLLKNWLNIDWQPHLELRKIYQFSFQDEPRTMLNYDLREGLPADNDELDAVYHCHLLEHLTFKEGLAFLAEIHRALKPGGLHRILVPDLKAFCRSYLSEDQLLLDKYREHALANDADLYMTPGAILMGMLHNHDHKMGWDWETLAWALTRAGFRRVRRTLFQESDLPDIQDIETYSPVRVLESLCVECYK